MALSRHTLTPPVSGPRPCAVTCASFLLALGVALGGATNARAAASAGAEAGDGVRQAVVKVYMSAQLPNQAQPWQTGSVVSGTGSGCILAGGRILTSAHVVERQTYLQVRRHGETRKHDARVLFVADDVDLALLTVDEPGFFDDIEPLELGPLPPTQASVVALGFPEGGDTLSLTNGVVSRIEHQYYVHSGGSFLAMQIDAAVNSGNSGGPVMEKGRVVGVVMQSLTGAQNISYVVPAPVVERFLADLGDGRYDGVPRLGVSVQPLENRAMRRRYGVERETGGVLLREVVPGTGAASVLRPGDVLLAIDGTPIAEDGTIEFRPGERTSFADLVERKQRGSEVAVVFVRDGRRLEARVPLTARSGQGRLVPLDDFRSEPSYFVFGGLVLRPLTLPYICTFGQEWWRSAPDAFLAIRDKTSSFEGEGLVALTGVFPDQVNQGYQDFRNVLVAAVDGVRPRNFQHAVELVEKGPGEFLTLTLADTNTIVLSRPEARSRSAAILARYHLATDRSADLRASAPLEQIPEPARIENRQGLDAFQDEKVLVAGHENLGGRVDGRGQDRQVGRIANVHFGNRDLGGEQSVLPHEGDDVARLGLR